MSTRFFIDTSARIKLYHREKGTDALDTLVSESPNVVIVVSALSRIELVSALARRVRMAVALTKKMAIKPGLRALDALELAACLAASKHTQAIFVVSDKKLAEAAGSQDLRVVPIAIEE